jgi:hypothetical protein
MRPAVIGMSRGKVAGAVAHLAQNANRGIDS